MENTLEQLYADLEAAEEYTESVLQEHIKDPIGPKRSFAMAMIKEVKIKNLIREFY